MQLPLAFCLATIAQSGPALPDFTAVSFLPVSPTSVELGDTIEVTATFASVGAPFTGNVPVAIVASGDPLYDSQDPVLYTGYVFFPGAETLDVTFALTVAPGRGVVPGAPAHLFAVIDPNGVVTEADETNNSVASSSLLTILGPDVRVTHVAADPFVFIGRPFTASITMENDSTIDANDFSYRYYVSDDERIRVFDTELQTFGPVSIPAGQTVTFTDTLVLPGTFTSTGAWYVGALADIFADLLESNVNNNGLPARPAVQILWPVPDLTAEVVDTATAAAAGEELAITRIISNIGPADAAAVPYDYFLSRDEHLDPSDVPLASFAASVAEATFDYGVDVVRIPGSVLPGEYRVLLRLDGDDIVEEVQETNNLAVGPKVPIFSATIVISTDHLDAATVGVPYELGLYAAGGPLPVIWSIASGALPPGITLDTDGFLTGTPTTEGRYEVTLRANSGTAHADRSYALRVLSPTVSPTFATTSLPAVFVGRPFCHELVAVGGQTPYVWRAATTLPPGVTFSEAGLLCGTVQAAGAFDITFEVKDDLEVTAQKLLTLHVLRASEAVQILSQPLPSAVVGESYCDTSDVELIAEGGLEPYRWSAIDGGVPGLELTSNGALCGVPRRVGLFPITVRVQDATDVIDTAVFLVEVATDRDFIITTRTLREAEVGTEVFVDLGVANADGTPTWSLLAGAGELPDGLALTMDGTISGTPAEDGLFAFVVRVEDEAGQTDVQPLSIRVEPAPAQPEPSGCTNVPGSADGSVLMLLLVLGITRRRRRA